MRKHIYQMVHVYNGKPISLVYKYFMLFAIALSLVPLMTKESSPSLVVIDKICLVIFIIDFILRLITADYKFNKHHWTSFARYPFRVLSIIDLLSIFAIASSLFGWLRILKIAQVLKFFRIVRICRYSKSIRVILDILKKSKKPLIAVGTLSVGYIVFSAIIIFNVEPDSFTSFFDAIYWATVSLTTVGYGDLYPITTLGRCVAMLSSFFGIAIVALPAGVITAEYLNILNKNQDDEEEF